MENPLLVFGGAGQIGLEIQRLSNLWPGHVILVGKAQANISKLADIQAIIAKYRPKIVLNLARNRSQLADNQTVDEMLKVNRTGAENLAKACAGVGAKLIHLSSLAVFGDQEGVLHPDQAPSPNGLIAEALYAGEQAIRQHLPDHIIVRTGWVYGLRGQNLMTWLLGQAKNKGRMIVVDKPEGAPTSATDVAECVLRLAEKLHVASEQDAFRLSAAAGTPRLYGTHHFSGLGLASVEEFAREMAVQMHDLIGQAPAIIKAEDDLGIVGWVEPDFIEGPQHWQADMASLEALGIMSHEWRFGVRSMLSRLLGVERMSPQQRQVG